MRYSSVDARGVSISNTGKYNINRVIMDDLKITYDSKIRLEGNVHGKSKK